MNKIGKIIKGFLLSWAILVLGLFVVSIIFEERISSLFVREVNRKLVHPAHAGKVHFSLLRQFPNASVQLDELSILAPEQESDTLVYAEKLIISLRLRDLLRKNLTVDRIILSDGVVSITRDSKGKTNTRFWKRGEPDDSSAIRIELKSIRVTDSRIRYHSRPGSLYTEFYVSEAGSKIDIVDDSLSLDGNASIILDSLILGDNRPFRSEVPFDVSVSLSVNDGQVVFRSTDFMINRQRFNLTGHSGRPPEGLWLDVKSGWVDVSQISELVPAGISAVIERYSIDAKTRINCSISSSGDGNDKPSVDGTIDIIDGDLIIPGRNILISKGIITTRISTLLDDPAESFRLQSKISSAELNGRSFSGSFILENLSDPYSDIILNGTINPAEIIIPGDFRDIEHVDGLIRINLRLSGKPDNIKEKGLSGLSGLSRSVNLNMSSVNLEYSKLPYPMEGINGNLMISENIWLDEVSFVSGGYRAVLNGVIKGFGERIENPDSNLDVTAAVWLDKFDTRIIENIRSLPANNNEDLKRRKPEKNLSLNMDIKCDSLISGKFRAGLFSGTIGYAHGFLNVSSFNLNALEGYAEGNAAIIRLPDGGYLTRGWFNIEHVNINEAFSVFNNFGQNQIVSKNLGGELTGNVSLSLSTDNSFKPDLNTLSVTGKYSINQGELIQFEPVMKLSRFVELEELEDIRFSELRNDLLIKDNRLYIPSMDIKSSAFDISLSGEKVFGGEHSYHIKLYLSDLLTSKAGQNNEMISEFGIIEDDELGRTSLLLKIEGSAGNSRVSYDMEALRTGIKDDMRQEGTVIRNILNEEYGWFGNDTLPTTGGEATRKFRIVWDEIDSLKTEVQVSEEKKLPLLNLFKKRKKNY